MNTQELAKNILDIAHDMKTFAYDADLIDISLNVIIQLCEEQLPQVTNYKREDTVMGGKPKTSTPADQRLKANNPSVGKKPATTAPAMPPAKKPATPKKGGK